MKGDVHLLPMKLAQGEIHLFQLGSGCC